MISEIISFQNRGVVSIVEFSTKRVNTIEYISGSEAIKQNLIEVLEISQTGSVNNLVVNNNSEKYIFLSDGDILAGAKQNRILNTSLFLAPNSTKQIPVSCVEKGRWNYISPKFSSTDYTAPVFLRAMKSDKVKNSLETEAGHYANQSEIWHEVENCCLKQSVASFTSNLSDVFDNKKKEFESVTNQFSYSDKANGLAVFINENILDVEVFNRQDIYCEYFPKILKGVSGEALHLKPKEKKLDKVEAVYKTNDFFDELENRKFKIFPGAGVGEEKRYESTDFSGFGLEYEGHLIHLAMLSLIKNF
ncbi:MAG: DUF6569 family protein [Ignavibacterium sp.]|nr:DUF6569 family protein [Ignavibacterium sp.]